MRSEQGKSAQTSCDGPKKWSGTSAPISLEDLMEADVPDLFFGPSRLGRSDFTCSLRMMLVMEGTRKEKKRLDFLFFL